jgi:dephospho-CoA kinase
MPLFDAVALLPSCPMRILVAGTSGAGKTTVASRVATLLDLPHVEIDALFHARGGRLGTPSSRRFTGSVRVRAG